MKKRFLTAMIFLLSLVFVVASFAACDGKTGGGDEDDKKTEQGGDDGDDTQGGGSSTEKKITYTVNVQSLGGAPIREVTVTVTEGTEVVYTGATNNKGVYTFKATGSEYDVSVSDYPLGYTFDMSKEYKLTKEVPTLTFSLYSQIITDGQKPSDMYRLGDIAYDFTLETIDGQSFTASEILKEKKMILLNFWHTKCNPCVDELPHFQAAYNKYSDVAAMFAVDIYDYSDRIDNLSTVQQFISQKGYTFPTVLDTKSVVTFGSFLPANKLGYSIPITIVIDRYGVIAFWQVGAFIGANPTEDIEALFEKYSADDYAPFDEYL